MSQKPLHYIRLWDHVRIVPVHVRPVSLQRGVAQDVAHLCIWTKVRFALCRARARISAAVCRIAARHPLCLSGCAVKCRCYNDPIFNKGLDMQLENLTSTDIARAVR